MSPNEAKIGMQVKVSESSEIIYQIQDFHPSNRYLVELIYIEDGIAYNGGTMDVSLLTKV